MAVIEFGAVAGKWSEAAKWVGGVQPGEGDDVVFSATSASCTITGLARCRSLNAELYKATLTQESELKIGTTTSNGGLCLLVGSGATITANSGQVVFASTSGIKEKITTGGKKFLKFKLELGKYEQMDDAWASTWEWLECEYITNNHQLQGGIFSVSGSTTEINLGKSLLITPSNGSMSWKGNSYKTLISSEATLQSEIVRLTYESSASQSWKKIGCKSGVVVFLPSEYSSVTVEVLEISTPASNFSTPGLEFPGGKPIVITKELKVNGAKDKFYVSIKSSNEEHAKLKFEAGVIFTPEFLEFQRITIEGPGTVNEANHCFDWGENEGITFKHNVIQPTEVLTKRWEETTSWIGGHLPTNCDDVVFAINTNIENTGANAYARSVDFTNFTGSYSATQSLHFAGSSAPAGGLVLKLSTVPNRVGTTGAKFIFKTLAPPSEVLKITTEGNEVYPQFVFEGRGKYELQDKFQYRVITSTSLILREEAELKTNNQTVIIGALEQEGALSKINLGSSTIICASESGNVFVAHGFISFGTSTIEITGKGEAQKELETNINALPLYDIVIASANVWFKTSEFECHNLTLNTAGLALIKSSITKFNSNPFTITNELKHNGSEGSFVFFESRELTQVSPLHLPGAYSTDYISIKGMKAEGPGAPFNAGSHSLDRGRNINWGFPSERYGSIPASVGPSVY